MAKAKKKAGKAGKAAKKEQSWPYYELGGIAIGVSPHPEADDAYALFVVVGETGYAVAGYADEEDAREAAEVLEDAMTEAQKLHTHDEDCDHGHEEFEIDLDDLEDEPKKKGKAKKPAAKKPAAKAKAKAPAKKPAKKGKR